MRREEKFNDLGGVRHPFTLDHYRDIIGSALRNGYAFSLFTEKPLGKMVYLRHDVDNCIDSAYTIAGIERELDIRSTYLLMIRSENYNVLAGNSIRKIREINAMGHEIGLHFTLEEHEEHLGVADEHDLIELIRQDAHILSNILDMEIRVFSFHNPTGKSQYQVTVPGLINTYSTEFFNDLKYISESNMIWRERCPCLLFEEGEYDRFQVLIHPLSYNDDLKSDRDVLLYFLYTKVLRLKEINEIQNATLSKEGVSLAEIANYFLKRQ